MHISVFVHLFFYFLLQIDTVYSFSEDEGEKADCCPAGGTAEVFRQLSGPASWGQGMDEKRIWEEKGIMLQSHGKYTLILLWKDFVVCSCVS